MSVTSVAIQFTLIDALSKGVDVIKGRMKSLARANKEVQNSFDGMARSAKYAALAALGTRELYKGMKPGVAAAGDLQAEMIGVRAEMMGSVKDAKALGDQLKQIKSTAFEVQAWTPFDQTQIVALEKQLIKAGAKVSDIVGKNGAAAASAALGTYEELDPVTMGKNLIGIATPFRLQADQYMNLADEISRASSASVVGAAEIAETAKYAAPAMAQLGRSTHEMLVLSAMLAQRGIEASMAGTGLRQFFNAAAKQKSLRDAAGNLLPLDQMLAKIRKSVEKMGEAEKLDFLTKIFDVRGAPVVMALLETAGGSYAEIEAAMKGSLSLQDKLTEKMKGLNAQWDSLRGTGKSVLSELFTPALPPLSKLIEGMNLFLSKIGLATQQSDLLSKGVSYGSLAGVVGGGLVTASLAGAALWYGKKFLKGVGGVKGLFSHAGNVAAGVAEGKAVEAATGVTPVFVTNWPAGGLGSGAAELAASTAGGGLLGKAGGLVKNSWKSLAGLASAATATVGGQVAIAGALGYGAGTVANKYFIDGTEFGDQIGALTNVLWAYFTGDEESKRAIEINMAIDQQGRVVTTSNDMTTKTNVSLNRGKQL